MAEIWGAAIAVGGAVISGYAKNKQADKDRKNAVSDAKAATKDEAKWSSILSQFNAEQDYYYQQLNRKNKERGLAEFRKFNTMSSFAPGYTQTNPGITVPTRRSIDEIESEQNANATANQKTGGGGGKSLLDRLDPLGSKLSKKDPLTKALKKLF